MNVSKLSTGAIFTRVGSCLNVFTYKEYKTSMEPNFPSFASFIATAAILRVSENFTWSLRLNFASISRLVRAKKRAALLPTAINPTFSSLISLIALKRFVFKLPHNPLSVEKTIISLLELFDSTDVSFICRFAPIPTICVKSISKTAYALPASAQCWAFFILEAATSSMAWVICPVLFTAFMRLRISRIPFIAN